jgi:hypothetical protein
MRSFCPIPDAFSATPAVISMTTLIGKALLTTFLTTLGLSAQTPFSSDSAIAYLKVLSVKIGPRTMGSPNEMKALQIAVEKFKEFGLSESYIMPMMVAGGDASSNRVNTNSGIAVGVLKGTSDRIIVLGAHIDSASPEIYVANDDGSGSAVILELARVLSHHQHQSTIVFALFCGEEQGLRGSRYFVDHFTDTSKIVMMIQVDMANGSDWLVPLIDTPSKSAPSWLVKASYEEYSKLGYRGLSYPTHFMILNKVVLGGGIGSDHEPFLSKNIPAIDFTSDVTDPIHTAQDNFENLRVNGLRRSGDLVYRLVERFDGGVPEEKTATYVLMQIGSSLFFVPNGLLFAIVGLPVVVAVIALLRVRKRRTETEKSLRRKIPAFKMFLLIIIIQTCVWYSENIVGLIKGVRFPWFSNPDGYHILAGLGGIIGIWIALNAARRLKLSCDPYRWYVRTLIFLMIFLLLSLLRGPALAIYPAFALCLLSAALLVKNPLLKLVLWGFSPLMMYSMMFSECSKLIARSMVLFSYPTEIWQSLMIHGAYILFFSIYAFPFLLGFAAIYHDSGVDLLWLKAYRKPAGAAISGFLFLGTCGWLSLQPSYTSEWKQNIIVEQKMNLTTGENSIGVRSPEYLKGSRIHGTKIDTLITHKVNRVDIASSATVESPWVRCERMMRASMDSGTTYDGTVNLRMKFRPYTLRVSYSSAKARFGDVRSSFVFNKTEHSITLNWYSFPDTSLIIPLHFNITGSDTILQTIEAVFIQQAEPIIVTKELSNVSSRSTVTMTEQFTGTRNRQ